MYQEVTLAHVLAFIKNADDVDKTAIRAVLNMSFQPSTIEDLMKPSMLAPHGLDRKQARAVQAAGVLGELGIGSLVSFPYNGVNYQGEITKINQVTAKVRITGMDGAPTKKGVHIGAIVGVPASILARRTRGAL